MTDFNGWVVKSADWERKNEPTRLRSPKKLNAVVLDLLDWFFMFL